MHASVPTSSVATPTPSTTTGSLPGLRAAGLDRIVITAPPRDRPTVWESLGVIGLGLLVGLWAAYALTQLMQSMLFQVTARDAATFAVVTLALAGTGLFASWLPARKAARLDPVRAIRWN